jgi:hypothetical protein
MFLSDSVDFSCLIAKSVRTNDALINIPSGLWNHYTFDPQARTFISANNMTCLIHMHVHFGI